MKTTMQSSSAVPIAPFASTDELMEAYFYEILVMRTERLRRERIRDEAGKAGLQNAQNGKESLPCQN